MPASVNPHVLLDELQAAEGTGAEALALWLARCSDPVLRGGLRVIGARDAAHARLARRRLAALGGTPGSAPSRQLQSLCGMLTASDVSNRSKLAVLLSQFPASTNDPLPAVLDDLDDETRALVETIRDDDLASLRWLREVEELLGTMQEPGPSTPVNDLLGLLDAYRAAEQAGAEVVAAWRDACALPGLRGGLDTIAEREATHAALLEARLRELGGAARARVDDDVVARARERFGASDLSDEEKLAVTVERYVDDDSVAGTLRAAILALGDDPETREMLRLIVAGEAATFAWLRSYRRAIASRPREVSLRVLDGGR